MSWLCCTRPAAELPIPRLMLNFPSPPIGREHCPSPALYLGLQCWAWSVYLSLACWAFFAQLYISWKLLAKSVEVPLAFASYQRLSRDTNRGFTPARTDQDRRKICVPAVSPWSRHVGSSINQPPLMLPQLHGFLVRVCSLSLRF